MKYLRKRFKLVLVLIVTALSLTSCSEDDNLKPNETPQEFANRICPIDEGLKLENLADSIPGVFFGHVKTEVTNSQYETGSSFYFKNTGPICDVVKCGIIYTTDGSLPTINNPNVKTILLKDTKTGGSSVSKLQLEILYFLGDSWIDPDLGTHTGEITFENNMFKQESKLDVNYYSEIEAFAFGANESTQPFLNEVGQSNYFSSDNPTYRGRISFYLRKIAYPQLAELDLPNVKYRGFIQSIKDDDVFYTPANTGVGPLPTAISASIETTNNALLKKINATITSKKDVNGFMYTSENSIYNEFRDNLDYSNWQKVFVQDNELVVNPNNPEEHSFSKEFMAENNKNYYVIAFTSNNNALTPATTEISLLQGFNTSAGKPTVEVSTTNTENSITISGLITNNGNTPVTAYGLKLYSDASYTTVIGENNQTGAPTSTFTFTKDALTPNTTYYAEAYATNSVGTGNARQEVTLTTVPVTIPTVTIDQPTSNDSGIVTLVGHVTDNGNGTITNYTFEITDEFGSPIVVNQANVTGNAASFTYTFDSLGSDTVNVKAKATNSAGTGESAEIMYSVF